MQLIELLEKESRNGSPPAWRYFNVVTHPKRGVIDAALDEFLERLEQELPFWDEYNHRVHTALHQEFRIAVPIELHPQHAELLSPVLQDIAINLEQRRDGGELLVELPGETPRGPDKHPPARFPSPEGLRWEEITMEFVSDDSIRIKARGLSETYLFSDIGFRDGRKRDLPTSRWIALRAMSEKEGRVTWDRRMFHPKSGDR